METATQHGLLHTTNNKKEKKREGRDRSQRKERVQVGEKVERILLWEI